MGGLGSVAFAPVVLDGRWLPGLTVVTDHPALACLASQYAGWQIDRDGYFAMASGPGRALIRAEELYDDLDVDERASTAVLCLETRDEPPDELAAYVAERAGVAPSDLTLLFAPTASLAGGVQVAARIVETALHKLHEIDFDVRRVVSGFGPARCRRWRGNDGGGDRAHERRGPLRRPGRAHRRRARRRARGDRRARAGVRVEGPRRAVRQGPREGGLGLLQDRSAALQPGRGPPRERRERADLPRRAAWTRTSSSGPSGDDRRDGHDDDQPRRHRQLRGDGRGVGRRGDRHQALPPTRTLRNLQRAARRS